MKQYDINEYSPIAPPYGGVSVFLGRLIKRLNKDGYSAGGYYTSECMDNSIIDSPLFEEFEFAKKRNKFIKGIYHFQRMFSAYRKFKVINLHGQELIFLPALFHLFLRQKIVVTVHNAMVADFYKDTNSINRWGFRYLAKKDIQWVAVSGQVKNVLEQLPFLFHNAIRVIPAYIPDDSTKPLSNSMQDYIRQYNKIITFYGRSLTMSYNNQDIYGFHTAIRLFKGIKEVSGNDVGFILCISDVSAIDGINALHDFAIKQGIDKNIYWQIGGIDNMRSLWKNTDVYIRPTSTDGDAVAIRDALAEGSAVVASDVCARPEGVLNYKFGDDQDLLNKVQHALNRRVRETYGGDLYYMKFKEIYNMILINK